jgi:N6-adenosine-specific RNA methylase IME4
MIKRYDIVYADPPWAYNDKMRMTGAHGPIRGAESFYRTMSIQDIRSLPVKNMSSDNSLLFIWVTMPLLKEGLGTIGAWGFEYKNCAFSWVKTTKNGKIHFGMGHYTRGNNELCLLGTRGKVPVVNHSVSQIVMSNVSDHSKKPDEVRDRIVSLVGDLPRIELFARSKSDGWDVWGNEVESSIDLGWYQGL